MLVSMLWVMTYYAQFFSLKTENTELGILLFKNS